MRLFFRFPHRVLAVLGGAAIGLLTAGSVQAQYYPYYPNAPYAPSAGYPMPAPMMYVPAAPSQQQVMPVGAFTGDYRTWGWGGKSCDCAPPCCPNPQVAPAPAPQPAPAPEMRPAPEAIQPPAAAPAPAQPPVVLQPSEMEQGPALGSGSFALATPGMVGDFLGSCSVRAFSVATTVNGMYTFFGEPASFSVPQRFNVFVAVPDLALGAFKVSENESPIPRDRVFAYFDHYKGALSIAEGNTISTANLPFSGNNAPFPPLTFSGNSARFDVYSEVIGFEKTFFDGRASVEVRVPFLQTGGGIPVSGGGSSSVTPAGDTVPDTISANFATTANSEANMGDLTMVLKYAPYLDRSTGNAIATGVAITMPTGPTIPTQTGNANCFLFQPYVGWLWNLSQNWYVQGFSSVAIPTSSNTDLLVFNDIGVGYWLYRGNGSFTGLIPTVEAHSNYAPNDHECVGYPTDELDLTGGVHLIFNRAVLTLAVSVPVTGPTPFSFEGQIEFNYNF